MRERIEVLERNIAELREFSAAHSLHEVQQTKNLEWALRYGLLETIQVIIDTTCHLTAIYSLGVPETYGECIELAAKYNYLDENLAKKLYGMVGLRNLLIHEYVRVDVKQLYDMLENINDFEQFLNTVEPYV
jgi:uncharacterized protein YutE (UPF0331/DUF86 family)